MQVTIQTTRFGQVIANSEDILFFKDGMVGLGALKNYVLVESQEMPLVMWLQSTEAPGIAFPLVEPWFFKRDYAVTPSPSDQVALELASGDSLKTFVVLTIPQAIENMTANLKAPVVLNISRQRGTQMILSDRNFEVRVPAYEAFQTAMAKFALEQTSRNVAVSSTGWNVVSVRNSETHHDQSF